MPIAPANWPDLQELSNGEQAISVVFNRPSFALKTRTESLRSLLETNEAEVVDARGTYSSLVERLDTEIGDGFSDANMFLTGGPVSWDSGTSTFTYGEITIVQANKSFNYTINSGSEVGLADGECLYVTLTRPTITNPFPPPDDIDAIVDEPLTLTKSAADALPDGKDIYAVAVRTGSKVWVRNGGEFEHGESRELGDGVTDKLLGRLGMADENDSASHFTSIKYMDIADTIPAALSKHDLRLIDLFNDRNMFIVSDQASWDLASQTFTYTDINILQAHESYNYLISAASTASIADGECLYVTLSRSSGAATLTISKAASGSLPTGADIYTLVIRSGDKLWVRGGGEFEDGESRPIGDGATDVTLERLGMDHELDTQSHFTSTNYVDVTDDIPEAISNIDSGVQSDIDDINADLTTIFTDRPKEEQFEVGAGGQQVFAVTSFSWDSDVAIPDVKVYIQDRKKVQSLTGALDRDFRKLTAQSIEFSSVQSEGTYVTIRAERTGGTGGGGGGVATDLENITVDPQPDTDGNHSLGTQPKAWSGVFLQDKVTGDKYELEVANGIFQVALRP